MKMKKILASILAFLMIFCTTAVGFASNVFAASSIYSVSNFGDNWYYYGRTDSAFFNDSFDMNNVTGWTPAPTPIGFYGTSSQPSFSFNSGTQLKDGSLPSQRGGNSGAYFTATYFKKTFTLPADFNKNDIVKIEGRHRIDDAMIMYVNGAEVYRFNAAKNTSESTPISSNTEEVKIDGDINWKGGWRHLTIGTAREAPFDINSDYSNAEAYKGIDEGGGKDYSTYIYRHAASNTNFINNLRAGDNVITCVVGQDTQSSSDLCFDLELSIEINKTDGGGDTGTGGGDTGGGSAGGGTTTGTWTPGTWKDYSNFVMSPGSDESSLGFTWYSLSQSQLTGSVAIRKQGEDSFDTYDAEKPSVSKPHKATVTGLLPDTTYEYMLIGANNTASALFTFKTGVPSNFSFIAVSDPQIGAKSSTVDGAEWKDTLTKALKKFPEVSFIASMGDQVEYSRPDEYTQFFSPSQLYNLPVSVAMGNHETFTTYANEAPLLHKDHFNLPNKSELKNLIVPSYSFPSYKGYDYWYVYGNALFMVLDANEKAASAHIEFLKNAISSNKDAKWRIIMMHQSLYSDGHYGETGGSPEYTPQQRTAWTNMLDNLDYKIDVVFSGHQHIFTRTYQMSGGNRVPDEQLTFVDGNKNIVKEPEGTVYYTLSSSSGSKYYPLQGTNLYSAINLTDTKMFSIVDVTDTSFKITTYKANSEAEYDTYEIRKAPTFVPVDKTTLHTEICNATALASSQHCYTIETWYEFITVWGQAQLVYNNPTATQSDVDTAAANLNSAIAALVRVTGGGGDDVHDIAASIRAESNQVNVGGEVEYIVSLTDPTDVAGVQIEFEIDGALLDFSELEGKNGFYIMPDSMKLTSLGNDKYKGEVTLLSMQGCTFTQDGNADIALFTFDAKEIGDAAMTLTSVKVIIAPLNDIALTINSTITQFSATTKIIADKTALKSLIATAETENEAIFTPDSWSVLQYALTRAIAVANNVGATQGEVDYAANELDYAINALGTKADKSALITAIANANDLIAADYTADTWLAVQSALTEADAIDDNSTQDEVDDAVSALNAAIAGLVQKANKDALIAAINEAETCIDSDYTTEKWVVLQTALEDAKTIRDNPDATQGEVDNAKDVLNSAIGDKLGSVQNPYDLNHDGKVDIIDLVIVNLYCDYQNTQDRWFISKTKDILKNEIYAYMCDFNEDGEINMLDLIRLFRNYTLK